MKNKKNGFALLWPVIIVGVIAVIGGLYFYNHNKSQPANSAISVQNKSSSGNTGPVEPTNTIKPKPTNAATQTAAQTPPNAPKSTTKVSPVVPQKSSSPSWTPGTRWINVDSINGKQIKTAVTWPNGAGPFPVIILLHGSEGFRQQYVTIAQQLSQSGFITIAACWFTGFRAPMSNFNDYVDCPNDPTFTGANTDALAYLKPLFSYAQGLAGSNGKIGMMGSSRGSTMALLAASTGINVKAVVAISAIYENKKLSINDTLPITLADSLSAPVLILHGTNDIIVNIQEAKDYAAKLTSLGKMFDSNYYRRRSAPFAFYCSVCQRRHKPDDKLFNQVS